MRRFPALQANLRFKITGVVVGAFAVVLVVSTIVLAVSVKQLGMQRVAARVLQEQLILSQRFAEAEVDLRDEASFIAAQPDLAGALHAGDYAFIGSIAQTSARRFALEDVIVTDETGRAVVNHRTAEGLLSYPDYLALQSQAEAGKEVVGTVVTDHGVALVALAPVYDDGRQIGTVTVANILDGHLLGLLNFGRSDLALVVFVGADSPGVSAYEADGQPHLDAEAVEMLRPDETTQARIRAGETVRVSDVNVKGSPHTVVYRPLAFGGEQVGYYATAIDEGQQHFVQNYVLGVSLVTLLIVLLLVGTLTYASISRLILAPLRDLSKAARKLADGDLSARAAVRSGDEVGQLALAFNDMADKIEVRARQLDELNRTLEARIRARTAEVQKQVAWLEAILSDTREAIIVTDRQRRVCLINKSALELVGVTEAEALDATLPGLLNGVTAEPVSWPQEADEGYQARVAFRTGDYFQMSLSPFGKADAHEAGYVCVLTDVTPLSRLDTLKTRVIRMASHDLRSPITAMRLRGYMLRREADRLSERQLEILGHMDETLDDLQRMVTDLLDVERIERQASGITDAVEMGVLLTSAASVMASILEAKEQQLVLDVPPDLPYVCGDPVLLLEVLRNLLTNASKYTPVGGLITARVYMEGETLCVEVVDNGIGIDPDELPHLFEPHYRARTALEVGEEGRGLGLSLVKKVVEEHGGEIWVKSERGRGSTFGFRLPTDPSCVPIGATELSAT